MRATDKTSKDHLNNRETGYSEELTKEKEKPLIFFS